MKISVLKNGGYHKIRGRCAHFVSYNVNIIALENYNCSCQGNGQWIYGKVLY